jgi:hypothetical protein
MKITRMPAYTCEKCGRTMLVQKPMERHERRCGADTSLTIELMAAHEYFEAGMRFDVSSKMKLVDGATYYVFHGDVGEIVFPTSLVKVIATRK